MKHRIDDFIQRMQRQDRERIKQIDRLLEIARTHKRIDALIKESRS